MEDIISYRRPIGRRITPQRIEFCRRAQSAEIGTVTRAQLAVLVQNLTCTGVINATESHLLLALVNTAPPESFNESGRPIVFKSNRQLAFEIGRSVGRVSRMLSRLFDAGLITTQDSGNYKRYPIRNADGDITDACGVDLRILIVRYAELLELVRQARAEKKAAEAALRRYRGALRNTRYALAVAAHLGAAERQRVAGRIERISTYVKVPAKAPSELLRRATFLLEWTIDRLMQLTPKYQGELGAEKSPCVYAENGIHKQITLPYQSKCSEDEQSLARPERPRFSKAGSSKGAFEESRPDWQNSVNKRNHRQALVSLRDVLRAAPALRELGYKPNTWADLVRLTPVLCRCTGISEDARRGAIEKMGEPQAAVAVAITLEKTNRQEVSSPSGYLRAMTERAAVGKLYLARSVFGLAGRNSEEQSVARSDTQLRSPHLSRIFPSTGDNLRRQNQRDRRQPPASGFLVTGAG
ncbi:replication protein C domain-containing protein (plasmid) [Rhizobium etli]|uniref:Replication protein C domain-containing protein n=1 Tax=Rhizobium etli TaxID=29449 RepID=A0AAN1BLG3_RHIET|nr:MULTISPECIES: plasmid replication protein RepC [Rhizobium]ARO32541.1 replication protein C domain-containing protein [Rhizobium sp. NXC14]ARQ13395.1 replication protein C domain-containing protein [Rhizobium etli]